MSDQTPASDPNKGGDDVRIEVIDRAEDIVEGFNAVAEAFGRQARDAIWTSMNPGWDDVSEGGGRAHCAARMVERWRATTRDRDGNPNTVFLKASVPDPRQPGRRTIAGVAIWVQASFVEGRGDPPTDDLRRTGVDLDALHPGDEREQRFVAQCFRSLMKRRVAVAREKAASQEEPPAIFVLDMCAVDPAFQRRGIASRLVRWGLEEARERRGAPECTTEASAMGRLAYARLGFRGQEEIVYEVDEEFQARDKPPNLFMRTGGNGN
ncbi:hypothetical protein DL767_003314 [Monosporascus sp. MG133]|nr:hypothetical protein DL767_003314 [Monosporascus sp. MG133]